MDPFPFHLQGDDEYQEYLNLAFSPPESFDLLPAISTPQLPPPQSAFVDYRTFNAEISSQSWGCRQQQSGGQNMHRRVIRFLRSIPMATRQESLRDEPEVRKELRHLMRERERRERLSRGFADLRYMLSTRSKGDKNSVIQATAGYLKELKGVSDELQKRNEELAEMVGVNQGKNVAIAEVERAMECALREAEKRSHTLSSQQCKFSLSCIVENAP
ncbi:transcription factor BHLH148 [Cocos nucifera]|uniref:Transcription factor BHLH148 n=1 Tax=Cocos nucifera TaxID=13894 RepID=A0A8K0IW79_COCNU|nr:transcription factor BHLH148 [Cocos nucifera]